ncbi:MAG: alpha/beta hydrolase-fold protein [Bdellovibrionota bacterium]
MEKSVLKTDLALFDFRSFDIRTLDVESEALAGNPLGDPSLRRNPVLVPKGSRPSSSGWPVVLMLSGFTGNGWSAFYKKPFELTTAEILDRAVAIGEAPLAIYVFCDAMTAWGGSQFIDSAAMGNYETYVSRDLVTAVKTKLPATHDVSRWCVMGGSSGGYGALHLASSHPELFGVVVAIAPDSFFEASLLGEIRTALPVIEKLGAVAGVKEELKSGRLAKRKDWHVVLNAVAMGLCYSGDASGSVEWPVDSRSGNVETREWARWLEHDPLVFLPKRSVNVAKWKACLLDVGTRDQFHLQYGTRQLADSLTETLGDRLSSTEFDGTHFDIGERRADAWKWLTSRLV